MAEQPIDFLLLYSTTFVLLAVVVLIGFVLEWRWLATKRYRQAPFRKPRVAQYSVFVSGLPQGTTSKQLVQHFNKLYSLDPKTPERVSFALCRFRPRVPFSAETASKLKELKLQSAQRGSLNPAHKVKNAKLSGRAEVVSTWVADVQLITQNSHILTAFDKMQAFKFERDEIQAQQMKFADNSPESNSALSEAAVDTKADVDIVLQRLDDRSLNLKYNSKLLGAFVTFNNEESWQRAVEDYSHFSSCCLRCMQPHLLRFHQDVHCTDDSAAGTRPSSGHRLTVEAADHPEDLTWTALTAPLSAKRARLCLFWLTTMCACLLLLAIHSSAVDTLFGALQMQASPAVCTYLAPAAAAKTLSFPDDWRLARRADRLCLGAKSAFVAWEGEEAPPPGQPKQFTPDPCFGGCVSAERTPNNPLCNTQAFLSGNQTVHTHVLSNSNRGQYTAQDVALCYCKNEIEGLILQFGVIQATQRVASNEATQGLCEDAMQASLVLQTFGPGYGALMAVMMAAAQLLAQGLNRVALHDSIAAKQRSIFRTQLLFGLVGVVAGPFVMLMSYTSLDTLQLPRVAAFAVSAE